MALNYVEQTYGTKTVETYEIDTGSFIVKGFLDSRDEEIIEAAVAGAGVGSTDMPNGQGTVLAYYSAFAKTATELETIYNRYAIASGLTSTIESMQATLDDHETRITTLEP